MKYNTAKVASCWFLI